MSRADLAALVCAAAAVVMFAALVLVYVLWRRAVRALKPLRHTVRVLRSALDEANLRNRHFVDWANASDAEVRRLADLLKDNDR